MSSSSSSTETPTIQYVAVVVAAGTGDRMGGPKALLAIRWGDNSGELPLGIAHACAHLEGGASRVILVVRADVARLLSPFAQRGLDIVVSSAPPELGPAGSIRHALGLAPKDPESWIMIEPVDMPASTSAIRKELLAAAGRVPPPAAVRPVYQGKRGHPVLVKRKYLDAMAVESPPTLRDVLHAIEAAGPDASSAGVVDVDVVDARAITTFEAPADVLEFYGHEARFYQEDEPTFA